MAGVVFKSRNYPNKWRVKTFHVACVSQAKIFLEIDFLAKNSSLELNELLQELKIR